MSDELLFPPQAGGAAALACRGLAIGYPGQAPLMAGVDLSLAPGRTLALVGGNGSGKTTFLKTVAGLLPPLSGQLEVLGGPARAASVRVAWLGQFHPANPLLPLRVRDVVRMAHFPRVGLLGRIGADLERVTDAALEFVGLADKRKSILGTLSGGQRQRVFIAYAIARRAPLVLLDEPQQNLDDAGGDLVKRALERWRAAGAALVMATHDRHDAQAAEHVLQFGA